MTRNTEQETITPLEIQFIEVTKDGHVFVSGRWRYGGHYGSDAAMDTKRLDDGKLLRIHSRLSEAIEERGLDD